MRGILLVYTLVLLNNSVWALPTPDEPTIVEIQKDDKILPVVKVESKEPEVLLEPIKTIDSTSINKELISQEAIVKSDVQPVVVKVNIDSKEPIKEEKPIVALLEVDSQGQGHENESDRVARQFGRGGFGRGFGGGGFGGGGFGGGGFGGGGFGRGRFGGGGGRFGGGRFGGGGGRFGGGGGRFFG